MTGNLLNLRYKIHSKARNSSVRVPRIVRQPRHQLGRPSKLVNSNLLRELFQPSRNLPLTKVAAALGIHRNTLNQKIKRLGLDRTFSQISDDELDGIIKDYRLHHPSSGTSYVISHLRAQKLRVQRWRVREAIERVDGVGIRLRTRTTITRRNYTNPRPMAVWHQDGHLKAILWGIAIHGLIDGYSRKVSCRIIFELLRSHCT